MVKSMRKMLLSCAVVGAFFVLFPIEGAHLKAAEASEDTEIYTISETSDTITDFFEEDEGPDFTEKNSEDIPVEDGDDNAVEIGGSVKNIMDEPTIDWSEYKGADVMGTIKDGTFKLVGDDKEDEEDAPTSYDGVDYGEVYDYEYYISKHPDIKESFGYDPEGALLQFLLYGIKEGRQAKDSFSVQDFKNANLDLRYKFKAAGLEKYLMYYMVYGKDEERDATDCPELRGRIIKYKGVNYSAVYDFDYYIKSDEGLAKKYKLDDYGALLHFIKYGMAKNLAGKEKYTEEDYKKYQAVSEVIFKNYKNGWLLHKEAWIHFTKSGNVDKLQDEAPTLTVIPGFFVTKMRTGNLNTREERIEAMIACALEYLGTPYKICTSREPGVGCDCSGLVMQALYAAGFDPYPATPDHHARPENEYDSRTLFHQTPMLHVDFSQLRRGDLVYYRSEKGNIIIHVAIYLGNGKVVEAWPPYVTDSYGVTAPPHPYVYGVTRPFP